MATPFDPENFADKKAKRKEYDRLRYQTDEYKEKDRARNRPPRQEHWAKLNLKRKEERRKQRELISPVSLTTGDSTRSADKPYRVRKYKTSLYEDATAYRREIKYGISPEQYTNLFSSQGNCCAICRSDSPKSKRGWCVDHDHKTGKVRGILCHFCNPMLGQAQDDIKVLESAIFYLKRFVD